MSDEGGGGVVVWRAAACGLGDEQAVAEFRRDTRQLFAAAWLDRGAGTFRISTDRYRVRYRAPCWEVVLEGGT